MRIRNYADSMHLNSYTPFITSSPCYTIMYQAIQTVPINRSALPTADFLPYIQRFLFHEIVFAGFPSAVRGMFR